MNAVELDGLTRRFGDTLAVDRLTLGIAEGEIFALVGPDGASVRAIAWRCADLPGGQALLSGQGGLNVAGRLKADDWNGRRGVQFEIEDVADPRMV